MKQERLPILANDEAHSYEHDDKPISVLLEEIKTGDPEMILELYDLLFYEEREEELNFLIEQLSQQGLDRVFDIVDNGLTYEEKCSDMESENVS